MKRLIIVMVLAIAGVTSVCAEDDKTKKQPASKYEYEAIRPGDQYIALSAGPGFSLFTITPSGINTNTKLNIGGIGAIGYSRFLTSSFSLGGEVNFGFNSTLGQNLFFYLPVYLKGTYEIVIKQFHIPLSLNAGFVFQTYNALNYFGPALKPELGVYYQYSPDWSFGVNCGWTFLPQWYDNSANNRIGNNLTATIGFRYHF